MPADPLLRAVTLDRSKIADPAAHAGARDRRRAVRDRHPLAYPGALIYELTPEGFVPTAYTETEHYRLTRAFLQHPESFLRHLFAGG